MSRLLSAIGLIAFVGLSAVHVLALWRVAGYYLPAHSALLALLLSVVWLGAMGLFLLAIARHRLKQCLLAAFLYAMVVLLAGTRVLEGVPDEVGNNEWNDPRHVLSPDARYLVHNHSNVIRVLSEAEYRVYLSYVTCYFTAAFMIFAAVLSVQPVDRDRQLFARGRALPRLEVIQPLFIGRCERCSGIVPSDGSGRWPAWCPRCGADLEIG